MNFKNWILNEEIYQNNTATVFHRTPNMSSVFSLITKPYKTGSTTDLGEGMYTTATIEGQFLKDMKDFGSFTTKWKVTELDKYLVCNKAHAIKIHGSHYSISGQLLKLNILDEFKKNNLGNPKEIPSKVKCYKFGGINVPNEKTCSNCGGAIENWEITLSYFDQNHDEKNNNRFPAEQSAWLEKSVKGCIYNDSRYGMCLLKYLPIEDGTITMLGYAKADVDDTQKLNDLKNNIGWTTSTDKASIKSIYKSSPEQKEKHKFEIPKLTITPTNEEPLVVTKTPFKYGLGKEYNNVRSNEMVKISWTWEAQFAIASKQSRKDVIDPVFVFSYENDTWNLEFKKENFADINLPQRQRLYNIPTMDGKPLGNFTKINNNSNLCFEKKDGSGSICFKFNFEEVKTKKKGEFKIKCMFCGYMNPSGTKACQGCDKELQTN